MILYFYALLLYASFVVALVLGSPSSAATLPLVIPIVAFGLWFLASGRPREAEARDPDASAGSGVGARVVAGRGNQGIGQLDARRASKFGSDVGDFDAHVDHPALTE